MAIIVGDEMAKSVLVHRINGSDHLPSWQCKHVVPHEPKGEGDLRLCNKCIELLEDGAKVKDEATGKECWPVRK
jgi:hypothetical protein